MTRRELVDAAIDGVRRRHVSQPQIGGERIAVELRLPIGKHLEGLQLGGKDHAPVLPPEIERLDAEPVANEAQRARSAIPQREGEHADETLDRGLDAPFGDGLDQNLGVGMSPEAAPARLELWAEIAGIVDLAVIGDDAGAAARHHRLRARRRKIDDGEPRMAERDAGLGVRPHAMRVRPAMVERRRHGAAERFQLLRAGSALEVQEAGDAAH